MPRRKAPTKENIQARAEAIMSEANVGFVKALIRARREFGIVSPNVGKVRLTKKERRLAEANGITF